MSNVHWCGTHGRYSALLTCIYPKGKPARRIRRCAFKQYVRIGAQHCEMAASEPSLPFITTHSAHRCRCRGLGLKSPEHQAFVCRVRDQHVHGHVVAAVVAHTVIPQGTQQPVQTCVRTSRTPNQSNMMRCAQFAAARRSRSALTR